MSTASLWGVQGAGERTGRCRCPGQGRGGPFRPPELKNRAFFPPLLRNPRIEGGQVAQWLCRADRTGLTGLRRGSGVSERTSVFKTPGAWLAAAKPELFLALWTFAGEAGRARRGGGGFSGPGGR